jgi:phosphoglycolate phosphatase
MRKSIVFDCDGTLLNMKDNGIPFEGIAELLHRLKNQDYALYVWTARDRFSFEKYMAQSQLMRFFDDTWTSSEGASKPSSEGIKKLVGSTRPQDVVVVGDSWSDMQGAQLFGAHGLGAVWDDLANPEALKSFGAKELVTRPLDCFDLIVQILS